MHALLHTYRNSTRSRSARHFIVVVTFLLASVGTGLGQPIPSLMVTYPNGGEQFAADSIVTIRWIQQDVAEGIRIEWSPDSGRRWDSIALVPSTTNEYEWTIPNTPTTEALVRLSVPSTTISDTSDTLFAIVPRLPPLQLLTPNGGETWAQMTDQIISWLGDTSVATLDIDWSFDNGNHWTDIALKVPMSPNHYTWSIPILPFVTREALIRIRNSANLAQQDISDRVFTVSYANIGVNGSTTEIHLLGAFPNPLSDLTELRWSQSSRGDVDVDLFSAIGSKVASYNLGYRMPGTQSVRIDGRLLQSGLYLYEVRTSSSSEISRGFMTVVR